MKLLPLLAIFLIGCKTTQSHDTAHLTASVGNAKAGVESAQRSTEALAGNVARARGLSDRIDAKSIVILKYFGK